MESEKKIEGKAVAIEKDNVDTDQIIPKQFLTRTERTGFGEFLFYHWRFLENGSPNPEFELNNPQAKESEILVAGENFGCGSSREHAVWALKDYGFKVVIASGFADIFFNNALRNGLYPIVVSKEDIAHLSERVRQNPGTKLVCDCETRKLRLADGVEFECHIGESVLEQLTDKVDPIEQTLTHLSKISDFEKGHFQTFPWFSPTY